MNEMRIVRFSAENVKKLTAISIEPDGNVVRIQGKNGAGKSSVLDAIWWALDGADNIQSRPIRKGKTKASIELDLGDIKVTRRFTENKSWIEVRNAEGFKAASPQKLLDGLVGKLSNKAVERMEHSKITLGFSLKMDA